MDIYTTMWDKIHDETCTEDVTISGIAQAASAVTTETKRLMKLAYEAGAKSMEEGVEIKWTCFEMWIIKMQDES